MTFLIPPVSALFRSSSLSWTPSFALLLLSKLHLPSNYPLSIIRGVSGGRPPSEPQHRTVFYPFQDFFFWRGCSFFFSVLWGCVQNFVVFIAFRSSNASSQVEFLVFALRCSLSTNHSVLHVTLPIAQGRKSEKTCARLLGYQRGPAILCPLSSS